MRIAPFSIWPVAETWFAGPGNCAAAEWLDPALNCSIRLLLRISCKTSQHAKGSTWQLKFQDPSEPKTRGDLIMGEYPHFNEYP
jgi:hypothetical protein